MKHIHHLGVLLACLTALVLTSCGSQPGPAQAIEEYFQALANKDAAALANLSCKAWEESALIELDSLSGVTAGVSELTCQEAGTQGEDSLVTCEGGLELNYNGELQELDLSGRTLIARYEDGEWRACGYK